MILRRPIAALAALALAVAAISAPITVTIPDTRGPTGISRPVTPIFCINPTSGNAESCAGAGGGGGGGASTIADGADVTQGAKADAAWSGTGAGSITAILKAIALGATDTSPIATTQSGTWTIANTAFDTNCDVVGSDPVYTAGQAKRCTMTAGGRIRVGLSSAATIGAAIATTTDLAGFKDPSGNQQAGNLDAAGNLRTVATPIDGTSCTITPVTANGAVLFTCDTLGYATTSFQLTGTFNASLQPQESMDNTTYMPAPVASTSTTLTQNQTTILNNGSVGIVYTHVNGPRYFRLISTAYTSGTVGAVAIMRQVATTPTAATPIQGVGSTNIIGDIARSTNMVETASPGAGASQYNGSSHDLGFTNSGQNKVSARAFSCLFYTDAASAANGAHIEGSVNGSTGWTPEIVGTVTASIPLPLTTISFYRYHRCTLLNGPSTQTVLNVNANWGE